MNIREKQYPWYLKLKLLDLFGSEIKMGSRALLVATSLIYVKSYSRFKCECWILNTASLNI